MQARTRAKGVANGRLRDAVNSGSSVASTQDSFAPSKMTQSSANSRTGLLDSSNRSALAQRGERNDDSLGPTRTQRRLKDPYAIDSDYEETDGYGTPHPPEREEESLADFLRNYDPPSTSTNARGAPVTLTGAPKPAKQSGPTIRERFARNIAVIPDYPAPPPENSQETIVLQVSTSIQRKFRPAQELKHRLSAANAKQRCPRSECWQCSSSASPPSHQPTRRVSPSRHSERHEDGYIQAHPSDVREACRPRTEAAFAG